MDNILKHKNAYIDAFKNGVVGGQNNVSYPNVDSTSPYYKEINEEQEVSNFAYEVGRVVKENVQVSGGSSGSGGSSSGGTVSGNYAPLDHNHDNIYAKIVHNHDDRYYTKAYVDNWIDRIINGDLLYNKINAKHIQAGTIVAGSSIIANGAIGSAHISSVSADKIDAGIIDTSKITVQGANGNLKLKGNRLQVFEGIGDSQFERVSLGDVNNDGTSYGLRVRGSDGQTILYDENGVYREGITDGSITNDKIGDDANIDGGKLNIHSVINNINDNNTGTIHGTKIDIDGTSLNSKIFEIDMKHDEVSQSIENQQAQITQNKENINLKVSNQKYEEDKVAMESKLTKVESDINVLNDNIALTVKKTELENEIKEVKDFVSTEIGSLTVGGANYVNNSAPRKATVWDLPMWDVTLNGKHRLTYWEDYNDSVQNPNIGYHPHIDLETFHFPCIALINNNAKFNLANRELALKQEIHKADEVLIPTENYIISFDAYADTELFNFHGGLYHKNVESNNYGYHSGRMDIITEAHHVNNWYKRSFSFELHKGIDLSEPVYLIINGHNNPEGKAYIKNVKLEKGYIPSDWTPSQFDIDDSLDDVVESSKDYTNQTIKDYSAIVDVKYDEINLRVDATETNINGVRGSVSEISQKADSLTTTVSDLNGKYTELKQTVDGFDLTGKVSFSDLSTSGKTTINGANITTGTLDTSKVQIKGGTTKKIVIANDNYCVYDGTETDINRKVFMGFRTNTATNVPSVMLGYNGINPNVDGAVVSGGTYTTYSHYPNDNNPEGVNLSYGALAFKYGAEHYQFSTLNMYQNGDMDLKSGASMYFRPNLRSRGNHVFAITDTSVVSRVPFQCTSSIYANGNITTDGNLTSKTANVSSAMNAGSVVTNRIDVYGNSNLDGNMYVSGTGTIVGSLNVKNQAIYGMNNIALSRSSLYIPNFGGSTTMDYIRLGGGFMGVTDGGAFHFITSGASRSIALASGTIYLPQGGGNTTTEHARFGAGIMASPSSGTFHFLTASGSATRLYASNVTSSYSLEPVAKTSNRSVFDEINSIKVVDTTEGFRLMDTSTRLTSTNETLKAVYTTYNEKTEQEEVNIDYTTAISTLWKAIQELKEENNELKKLIKGVE